MIQWFEVSDSDTALVEDRNANNLRFLEGGRFLYVRDVSTFPRTYYCAVSNARLHSQEVSPTRYILNGTGLLSGMDDRHVYKEIGDRTAFVGDEFEFSYVATVGRNNQECNFEIDGAEQIALGAVGTDQVLTFLPGEVFLACIDSGFTVGNVGILRIFGEP